MSLFRFFESCLQAEPGDQPLRFVYRYGNLLQRFYPLLDGLVKCGIPDNPPLGRYSYKVEITDTTKVMVDLRGVIRAEHENRQKTFFFDGKSDINQAFLYARRFCLHMHDNPPPPPVRKNARCMQQRPNVAQASQEAKPELKRLLPLADGRLDQDACPVRAPQEKGVPGPLVVDISYPDGAGDDDATDSWDTTSESDCDIKSDATVGTPGSPGSPPNLFSDSDSDASDMSSMLEPEPEYGDKRRRCD